jgi:hypothetical protein
VLALRDLRAERMMGSWMTLWPLRAVLAGASRTPSEAPSRSVRAPSTRHGWALAWDRASRRCSADSLAVLLLRHELDLSSILTSSALRVACSFTPSRPSTSRASSSCRRPGSPFRPRAGRQSSCERSPSMRKCLDFLGVPACVSIWEPFDLSVAQRSRGPLDSGPPGPTLWVTGIAISAAASVRSLGLRGAAARECGESHRSPRSSRRFDCTNAMYCGA